MTTENVTALIRQSSTVDVIFVTVLFELFGFIVYCGVHVLYN